jgi:hypothetical protein
LQLETQSHDPVNAVFLNDHFLGYVPMKDWTYSWVSVRFPVSSYILRQGHNTLTVRAGSVAPKFQSNLTAWDEIVFRNVILERVRSR